MPTIEELHAKIDAGGTAKLVLQADTPGNLEKANLTISISQTPTGHYKWRKFYHDLPASPMPDREHQETYPAWKHMIEAIVGIQTYSDQWVLES
jgi:hypothetical protein